jgi:3-deoxy-D-manno-octulosonate 8-phosphate phosphatase (KDO 8-P phosphatase)
MHSSMSTEHGATFQARLAAVRLVLCDVDGVLTDGTVFIGAGVEMKAFNIQDGMGIAMLRHAGLRMGWISSRPSMATAQRAQELRIDFLHQEKGSKIEAVERILSQAALSWAEVCFIGDDLVDLAPIGRARVGVAVANAVAECKAAAALVTQAAGGHGAVREVIEMILKAQNKWESAIQHYA